jgi:hypothetical protein
MHTGVVQIHLAMALAGDDVVTPRQTRLPSPFFAALLSREQRNYLVASDKNDEQVSVEPNHQDLRYFPLVQKGDPRTFCSLVRLLSLI